MSRRVCTNAPVEVRILHCWADLPWYERAPVGECPCKCDGHGCEACTGPGTRCFWGALVASSATCLLPRGHVGPHRFTDDDKWGVAFRGSEERAS